MRILEILGPVYSYFKKQWQRFCCMLYTLKLAGLKVIAIQSLLNVRKIGQRRRKYARETCRKSFGKFHIIWPFANCIHITHSAFFEIAVCSNESLCINPSPKCIL